MKKLLTLKILLPVFACLLIALLVFQIKCLDFHNDGENGLIFIVAILVNIIPMFAMVILGFICVVLYVLLLTLRNKRGVIKGLLVVLCVMVPFVAFNAVIDIMALSVYVEVPILACVALATNIATLIMCPLALREIAN